MSRGLLLSLQHRLVKCGIGYDTAIPDPPSRQHVNEEQKAERLSQCTQQGRQVKHRAACHCSVNSSVQDLTYATPLSLHRSAFGFRLGENSVYMLVSTNSTEAKHKTTERRGGFGDGSWMLWIHTSLVVVAADRPLRSSMKARKPR